MRDQGPFFDKISGEMFLLFVFSFVAGLATILAPCVWPLLPVVLSASIRDGKWRPIGVAVGLIVSFAVLTLSLSSLVRAFGVDQEVFRNIAALILLLLGITLIVPQAAHLLEIGVGRLTSGFGSKVRLSNGLAGGFVTGLALGVVWTPCSGPILAAIATLAGTGSVGLEVVGMTVFFSIGTGVPLLLLALGGKKLLTSTKRISSSTPLLQKVFGIVMVLTAVVIFFDYDRVISSKLLDAFPALNGFPTSFENNDRVLWQLHLLQK